MTPHIPHILLLTTLLFAAPACKESPRPPNPTPIQAQLATVDPELSQPIQNAVLLEITPDRIRISLDRLIPAWQHASNLQDEKILQEGPWWCRFSRERCLNRKKKPCESHRLAPLPKFTDIPIQNGMIPAELRMDDTPFPVIPPAYDQLSEAYKAAKRISLHLEQLQPQDNPPDLEIHLLIAIDERLPMSTVAALFYTAAHTYTFSINFLVKSPQSRTQGVYFKMHPTPMFSGWLRYQDDIRTSCAAAPEVFLNPQAVSIRLWAICTKEMPAEQHLPPDRDLDSRPFIAIYGDRNATKPDWHKTMLLPEADAKESFSLTENNNPAKAIKTLLKNYDKNAYYPGITLTIPPESWPEITFSTWINIVAELQTIDTFQNGLDLQFFDHLPDLDMHFNFDVKSQWDQNDNTQP